MTPFWRRPRAGRRRADAPEFKDSRAGPMIALHGTGRPRWTPRDYASLADEGFVKNPVAYRCVRMIAEAAASVPLAVFRDGVRRDDDPAARLLAKPNPEQSGVELLEAVHIGLQTAGNAYVEGVGAAGRPPDEVWALRPDRVKIVPGRSGWPEAYDYEVAGRSVRIGREADGWSPVMHLRLHHPTDDHYGLSPMEAAAFAIDVHNASGAWNKALLDNAARPSGALIYGARDGERLTTEQFETLKAELADSHQGARNAGRPLLLEGGLDWKPMSLSPAEMNVIEGKHAAAREIGLAFGVPSQLLGIPGEATYANYREAQLAFWRQAVLPLVRKTAGALSGWLGQRSPGLRIEPDLEAVAALQPERDALWARLAAAPFLTVEERRRMAGLGQLEAGE
ncbi:phage portal protein [Brevundimonas sp. VNH65]|uniref:phage portal protein n=1 Tax=Brevundimonas sp. VNH65 TaxID=3400917 RepID=UPI003BFDD743